MRSTTQHPTLAATLALLLCTAGSAAAGTVHVAANGVDAATCGTKQAPCRSITQGIAQAGAGDTVLVGPGRYGSANFDSDFIDPGDEPAEIGTGCECIVDVDKQVSVVSRDGATATVIDAQAAAVDQVVRVSVDGASFGAKGKGFTLVGTGAGLTGVRIHDGTNDVKVAGNHAVGLVSGFANFGADNVIAENRVSLGLGVSVNPGIFSLGGVVTGNSVENCAAGIMLGGSAVIVTKNVVVGNDVGIELPNLSFAAILPADGSVITKNVVTGNQVGVRSASIVSTFTVEQNSIFGNGKGLVVCGSACTSVVDARHNFWGAASGPGADPADEVESLFGATVDTSDFSTKEIKVTVKPQR